MQPKVKGFGKDRREMSAEVKTKEMGAMKIQLYKCKDPHDVKSREARGRGHTNSSRYAFMVL